MISSLFFPDAFEADLRPIILVIAIMLSSIAYVIKKNWSEIKDDFDSDWEK
jgi:hypothetical protein